MLKLSQDGTAESPAPDFYHNLIIEQRGAAEELKALCKELQTLLDDLLIAKPELLATYQQIMGGQDHPKTHHRQSLMAPQDMSIAQCKREAERNRVRSIDLIRECGQVRHRSQAMRAALRGAIPMRLKTVAENDGKNGLQAKNVVNGFHAKDGLDGKDGHHEKDGERGSNHKHDGLSRREFQVLRLMVDGKSSKEIAVELGISFKTAVTHRASIMSKMDLHEIASVVREAIRRGLV